MPTASSSWARHRPSGPRRLVRQRLAEAVNGLFKTEVIRRRGPWRTIEQVELATLEWVWWWNNQHLHSELGDRTRRSRGQFSC